VEDVHRQWAVKCEIEVDDDDDDAMNVVVCV